MASPFWPRRVPLWLALVGNISTTVAVVLLLILLLPHSFVAKFKLLRRLRHKILKGLKRVAQLSTEGPFYRLFVHSGRKLGQGRLSSRCRIPEKFRARATGASEASLSFTPREPLNPFHEENYVVAWQRKDCNGSGRQTPWTERPYDRAAECEDAGGSKLKVSLEGLPEQAAIILRICAVNTWGRSDWSEEVSMETMAKPGKDNGFTGPLGPAGARLGRPYRWSQGGPGLKELGLFVPVDKDWKAKNILFKATPSRIEIRVAVGANSAESEELLSGAFPKKVKADEIFWTIDENEEDGRHLSVQLPKADQMAKWPCLIDAAGHPQIDVRFIRLLPDGLGSGMGNLGGLDIWE